MVAGHAEYEATEAYRRSVDEVCSALGVHPRNGLSRGEARARPERYGKNVLAVERRVPAWRRFFGQFQEVLVILLLIAAGISGGLWLYERDSVFPYEAVAIFAIVLLNAIMGYIQESRAEEALVALRHMSASRTRVIRDGEPATVPATDIVPGDIIVIEEGDTIPADARLIESTALQTAEAALTGESFPVLKEIAPITTQVGLGDRLNMVFSGTTAIYGRGRAAVVATGMQTQIGRIAGMLQDTPRETTPLQRELNRVGKLLGIIVVLLTVVMTATIILVEDVTGLAALFDVLLFGVALAVAAVPEGLPAVVTAVLSLGVQRMAEKHAIVSHLASVETLGSANVIASDKTGTLTKNEMTVRTIVTASGRVNMGGTGYEPRGEVQEEAGRTDGTLRVELVRTLIAGDRANNAVLQERNGRWAVLGDPTEGALIVAARKAGVEDETLDSRFTRIAEIPFSSGRKLMSTVHKDAEREGCLRVFTKGAPDILLARCPHELVGEEVVTLTEARRTQILKKNEELAGESLRTLGVAFRSLPGDASRGQRFDERIEQDLVFLGLIGMIDPPREEARVAVARAKGAGIRPVMITGDHPATAVVIARELGITANGRAITGAELQQMSEKTLEEAVQEVSIYARVNPQHKLRIVKALQRNGATVAMTGDGVNDAPALKTADIGIAMGITGTDVSKEAADMVLADDNFASIVAAIEEGRAIFSNIRKFLRYLLSSNMGEVLTVLFGLLLADLIGLRQESGDGMIVPVLATQILWLNLVTDGAPALALGMDPAYAELMTRPPRPRQEGVITGHMWTGVFLVGIVMAAGTLFVIDTSLPGGFIEGTGTTRYAQTMAFTTLVLFSLFTVFNARSDERSAFAGMFANLWLWGAVVLSLLLQIAVIYVPFLQHAFSTVSLTISDWLLCTGVASSVLWLRELSKIVVRQLQPG